MSRHRAVRDRSDQPMNLAGQLALVFAGPAALLVAVLAVWS